MVTPLAGVWVEIMSISSFLISISVTPLAGVWVEIEEKRLSNLKYIVTPLAGVWVEILWEQRIPEKEAGHSPCGSVG